MVYNAALTAPSSPLQEDQDMSANMRLSMDNGFIHALLTRSQLLHTFLCQTLGKHPRVSLCILDPKFDLSRSNLPSSCYTVKKYVIVMSYWYHSW